MKDKNGLNFYTKTEEQDWLRRANIGDVINSSMKLYLANVLSKGGFLIRYTMCCGGRRVLVEFHKMIVIEQ